MARTVSVLAGIIAISAITYKLRNDMIQDTDDIRRRLNDSKGTLDQASATRSLRTNESSRRAPYLESVPVLGGTQRYVSERLVPSVKESWNSQVTQAAHAMVNNDLAERAQKLWNEKVLGNAEKE